MSGNKLKEGWAQPGHLRNRHYFRNGRAVCGMLRWGCSGPYDSNHDNIFNCGYCFIIVKQEAAHRENKIEPR